MKPLRLKNTQAQFIVTRDAAGVPHIQADSWLDALYALGYMHANDRGSQLHFARSVASGRAAEEIANQDELVQTDCFFRKFGLHLELDGEANRLSDEALKQIQTYCNGVNDGIAAQRRSLPMWATGYEPRPWDPASVLLVGKLLSFGGLAIGQMQNERLIVEMIHAGVNDEGLRELFAPRLDDVDFDLLRKVKMSNQLSNEALELLTDLPRLAGSNAWAVSPKRTAGRAALLASDPHLEINRLPAIWYEASIRFGDRYVMGASLPGCPLFAVARTERLAWGVTYMKGDTIDYFIEDCRLDENDQWQYRRGDKWREFRIRQEVIDRKGAEPLQYDVYENDQGTLDCDPSDLGPGLHLSVAWTGNHPGGGKAISSWLDVIATGSAAEAMDVARDCTQPTLCWVFADRDGHIGLQGCGRFPRRGAGQTGFSPIPAWDTKNHWRGWLPKETLPRIYDPPVGFVATANEEINAPDGPLLVTQTLPGWRKMRIDSRLAELPQATIEDMQSMQYDLFSVHADEMLKVFLPHLPQGAIKTRLSQWDRRYSPDSYEAALFQRLYRHVLIEVFGHERGIGWRRMLYLCSRSGYSVMFLTAADRVLAKSESSWWRLRDKGELVRRAAMRLEDAPEQTWADVNNFHFTDRFFGNHSVGHILGFNSRRYPMAGDFSTPFQGHVLQTATRESTFAPSYHFVTDLSTDQAWTNLPGGPSENRFSKYYKNDVALWLNGEYKRLTPDLTEGSPET